MTETLLIEKLRPKSFEANGDTWIRFEDVERIVREHEAGKNARLRYLKPADKQNSMFGLVEVFEDMIRYNGNIIWHGNSRKKSEEEINAIIEEYKKKREAQKGNSRAWYEITDMTGEVHRFPINIKNAAEECILREHEAGGTARLLRYSEVSARVDTGGLPYPWGVMYPWCGGIDNEVYDRKIITPKPIPYEPMYAEESCKAREHKAQADNPKAWYEITDMTGEVHRIPMEDEEAERRAENEKLCSACGKPMTGERSQTGTREHYI